MWTEIGCCGCSGRKTYVDGYVDAEAVVLRPRPRVVVEFVEVVVAHDQRVLGQLLIEALGLRAVDEEVQRLSHVLSDRRGSIALIFAPLAPVRSQLGLLLRRRLRNRLLEVVVDGRMWKL